jgi:hypothetical protein
MLRVQCGIEHLLLPPDWKTIRRHNLRFAIADATIPHARAVCVCARCRPGLDIVRSSKGTSVFDKASLGRRLKAGSLKETVSIDALDRTQQHDLCAVVHCAVGLCFPHE